MDSKHIELNIINDSIMQVKSPKRNNFYWSAYKDDPKETANKIINKDKFKKFLGQNIVN